MLGVSDMLAASHRFDCPQPSDIVGLRRMGMEAGEAGSPNDALTSPAAS